MKVVVISDIHIRDEQDPLYHLLLKMILKEANSGDVLVLAGDIFDFLVGRQPTLMARYEGFFRLLREKCEAGVRVTYIEGNHDFHLESSFKEIPGVSIQPVEAEFQIGLKKIYVAHGDLVDQEDHGYLFLRRFFRSVFIKWAALVLPSPVVEWIGNRSSRASSNLKPRIPTTLSEARLEKLRSIYRGFAREKFHDGFDAVVLGHCHDLDGANFIEEGRMGSYLNVGYPRSHHSYVVFDDVNGLHRRALHSD